MGDIQATLCTALGQTPLDEGVPLDFLLDCFKYYITHI